MEAAAACTMAIGGRNDDPSLHHVMRNISGSHMMGVESMLPTAAAVGLDRVTLGAYQTAPWALESEQEPLSAVF